jgi:hypothetical protein
MREMKDKELKLMTTEELGVELLSMFGDEIRMKLDVPLSNIGTYVTNIHTEVASGNGRYSEKKHQTPMFELKTDCFRLAFTKHSDDTIELYWIEVFDKCKGMGSELMNIILDTADEMGVNVRCIPTDMKGDGNIKTLYRIRDWYRSFGFEAGKLAKAVFTYSPQV